MAFVITKSSANNFQINLVLLKYQTVSLALNHVLKTKLIIT